MNTYWTRIPSQKLGNVKRGYFTQHSIPRVPIPLPRSYFSLNPLDTGGSKLHRSSLSLGITRGGTGKPHSIPNNNRPSIVQATRFNEINEHASLSTCLRVGGRFQPIPPFPFVHLSFSREISRVSFQIGVRGRGRRIIPLLFSFARLSCLSNTSRPTTLTLSLSVDWEEEDG